MGKDFDENTRKRLYKEQKIRTIRKEKKIGRNDPCPCGSGKNIKSAAEEMHNERVFRIWEVCVVLFNTCHLFPQTAIDLAVFSC